MPTRLPVTNADQVQAFVAATGAGCPKCGYCLTGLRSDMCPECGKHLSIATLCKRRWYEFKPPRVNGGGGVWSPIRVLAALNILIAAAIMFSAIAHHGRLPILSWLAPGILGAFAFSIQYIAVFAKYSPMRYDPVERWGEGTAMVVLAVQVAGLILMWV
jgi:predicted amidophosphoribosyltransferase